MQPALEDIEPQSDGCRDQQAEACVLNWSLSDLLLEGETPNSRFNSCRSKQYGRALLKILTDEGLRVEGGGFEVLSKYPDNDAVQIFAFDRAAAVMEVLDGPRLLDIIDEGDTEEALEIQLELTERLLSACIAVEGLKDLQVLLSDSLAMKESDVPVWARDVIPEAQAVCRSVLRSRTDWRPLHGDLHPRNILMHQGVWKAIDARGIYGPVAFEFSNTFINPWDRKDLIFEAGRMKRLAENISGRLGCSIDTVLECALTNALYYAQIGYRQGQGRHPTKCIRELLALIN